LKPAQNEALRKLCREIIDRDFDGVVSRAAAAQPGAFSHSMMFAFLNGERGASTAVLDWLSARTGRSNESLRGLPERIDYEPGEDRRIPSTAIGHHPQWRTVKAEVLTRFRKTVDPEILDEVANASFSNMPRHLTAEFVKQVHDALVLAKQGDDDSVT
jgi:hypothetical protein